MSPRKQSLLGELNRAPADRRSRFGLRRFLSAGSRAGAPPAPIAAAGIADSLRSSAYLASERVGAS